MYARGVSSVLGAKKYRNKTALGFARERFRAQHVADDENGGEAREGYTENYLVQKTGVSFRPGRDGAGETAFRRNRLPENLSGKSHIRRTAFEQSVGQTPRRDCDGKKTVGGTQWHSQDYAKGRRGSSIN